MIAPRPGVTAMQNTRKVVPGQKVPKKLFAQYRSWLWTVRPSSGRNLSWLKLKLQ